MEQKGTILFTSESPNCKACKRQNEYFGEDLIKLKELKVYKNCDITQLSCNFRGVSFFPTWYLGRDLGIKVKGSKELKELARLTNCPW